MLEGSIKDKLTNFILPFVCRNHTWNIFCFMKSKKVGFIWPQWPIDLSVIITLSLILDTGSRMRPLHSDRKANDIKADRFNMFSWWLFSSTKEPSKENKMEQFLTPCIWCHLPSLSLKYTKHWRQKEIKLVYSVFLNINDTLIMKNKWFPSVKLIPKSVL